MLLEKIQELKTKQATQQDIDHKDLRDLIAYARWYVYLFIFHLSISYSYSYTYHTPIPILNTLPFLYLPHSHSYTYHTPIPIIPTLRSLYLPLLSLYLPVLPLYLYLSYHKYITMIHICIGVFVNVNV